MVDFPCLQLLRIQVPVTEMPFLDFGRLTGVCLRAHVATLLLDICLAYGPSWDVSLSSLSHIRIEIEITHQKKKIEIEINGS